MQSSCPLEPDVPCKSVKTSSAIVLGLCATAVICCSGVGFLGYRTFTGARAADSEADHFADTFFSKFAANYDTSAVSADIAPEWKAQPKEIQDAYNNMFRTKLGPLVQAEPFSSTSTNYQTYNGQGATIVYVASKAKFAKADGTVRMTLEKRNDVWQVVSMRIFSPALANGKPTRKSQ